MHRAQLLDAAPTIPPRRQERLLPALLAPWLWTRFWDRLAQKEARRLGGAFVHFGPRVAIHLPEGSYSVPWHRVEAHREGPSWRIDAAGLALSVVDEHLSRRERQRLQSSTCTASA